MRCIGFVLLLAGVAQLGVAESLVTAWTPLFQGVDHAIGTNDAGTAGPLSVNAIRIDLQDPDVELMVTPALTNNYAPNSRETALQTPREFLRQHGLQLAINSGSFTPGLLALPPFLFPLG